MEPFVMPDDQLVVEPIPPENLQPIESPAAWYGPDMAARESAWAHRFTAAELDELDQIIRSVEARALDIASITSADVPLPGLVPLAQRVKHDVLYGRGFFLIRGFPVERYTVRQAAIAYWAFGVHLGNPMSQNAKGHALGHVQDLGFDYNQPLARGYQTSARLPYHTDASDIVGLLSVTTSKSGGLSSIVSSVTVFNEMVRRRPDLASILTGPLFRDRRGEIPEGHGPWYAIPAFNVSDGRVATTYVRSAVRKAQRFDDVPRLTAADIEALDTMDALAEDPAIHLDMTFEPGDMQFLCNHTIMHSRTAYEDWPEPERRRHLLRLWLACPDGPPLPAVYGNYQNLTADGRPNGILLPGVALNAPIEAKDGGPGEMNDR